MAAASSAATWLWLPCGSREDLKKAVGSLLCALTSISGCPWVMSVLFPPVPSCPPSTQLGGCRGAFPISLPWLYLLTLWCLQALNLPQTHWRAFISPTRALCLKGGSKILLLGLSTFARRTKAEPLHNLLMSPLLLEQSTSSSLFTSLVKIGACRLDLKEKVTSSLLVLVYRRQPPPVSVVSQHQEGDAPSGLSRCQPG